jgi:hypothetical protein
MRFPVKMIIISLSDRAISELFHKKGMQRVRLLLHS